MEDNAEHFYKKMTDDLPTFKDYVKRMRKLTEWGTNDEIVAAASILKSSIFVYTPAGSQKLWVEYAPCSSNGVLLNKNNYSPKCVYLIGTGSHFMPVLDLAPAEKSPIK